MHQIFLPKINRFINRFRLINQDLLEGYCYHLIPNKQYKKMYMKQSMSYIVTLKSIMVSNILSNTQIPFTFSYKELKDYKKHASNNKINNDIGDRKYTMISGHVS